MEREVGLKIRRTRDDDNGTSSVTELRITKDRAGPVFVSRETHAMFILTCHLKENRGTKAMELEVGLKIRRTRDDDNGTSSVTELRIAKDRAGPVFVSRETHAMFILTCHLKGYKRNSFEIKISEDGREISISGEKPIQEILMMGRVMLKKEVEIVGFRKVFKIPNGVVLDRIKAKYDEDESVLKIVMPKLVKGICGVQIEEVKREEGFGEPKFETEERDKERVEDTFEGTQEREIGEPKFETESKDEERVGTGISKEGLEAVETTMEGGESEKVLAGKLGLIGEDIVEVTKQREIEEPKVKIEDRDKESVEDIVEGRELREIEEPKFKTEDRDKERVEDIFEGTQKKEIGEPKFETEGKDEDRVGTEITKEGLEAKETTMEGGESEKVLAGAIGVSGEDIVEGTKQREIEEAKFETKGKDKEKVGREITKEEVEAEETTVEGVESEKVLTGKIGVSREDIVEGTEQREIEEPKFETEDRDKERVEDVFEGTQKKEIRKPEFETEGKDEERVGREITKEEVEAVETTMEGVESERFLTGKIGFSREDIVEGTEQKEIEEPKFESEGKDEDRVGTEISEEGLEAKETTMEGGESEKVLAGAIGVSGEDIVEGTKQRDIEEAKFETKGKDEERVGREITKEEVEAVETTIEGVESEKVLTGKIGVSREDIVEGTEQREIEEPKFETEDRDKERVEDVFEGTQKKEIGKPEFETEGKDEERVGKEITKEEVEAVETTMEGVESERFLTGKIGVSREDIVEGTEQKEIEEPKFESEGKDEDKVGTEISEEGLEAKETTMEGGESEKVLAGAIGVSGEDIVEGTKQREIEEAKFETKGKDEERVEREITKEEVEAVETTIEGAESEKVLTGKIGVSREDIVEGTEQREIEEPKFETEDRDKERVEDLFEGTQKIEIGKPEFETEGKDEERVGKEITKEEVEAVETTMEGVESERFLTGKIGVSREDIVEGTEPKEIEEPKFEAEGKDEDRVGTEISKEGLEAKETTMEGGESEKVLAGAIGVSGEDIVEGSKQREIEEAKFETKGKDEERVGREITKEEVEAVETTIDRVESEKVLTGKIGVGREDIVEGTEQREIEEPKFETEDRDKERVEDLFEGTQKIEIGKPEFETEGKDEERVGTEISKEGFEAVETTMEGGESEKVLAGAIGVSGEDIVEGTKHREIEVPKFETEEAKEAMAKRGSQEAEGFMEKVEGEEPKKMKDEASKVIEKDYARELEKKGIEESDIRPSRNGQDVQENTVRKVFEVLGTVIAECPRRMVETKAQREREVKVKGEVVIKIHDDAKEGFEKAITGDRAELETGQPSIGFKDSDERGDEKCTTTQSIKDEKLRRKKEVKQVVESMRKTPEKEHPRKANEVKKEVKPLEAKVAYPELRKEVEPKNEVEEPGLKQLPPPKVKMQSLEPLELEKESMKRELPKTKRCEPEAREEKEEYEAAKPPEVKSSSPIQQSMVEEKGKLDRGIDKLKFEIDFPESSMSKAPSEDKEMEALQSNILADQNLEEKEYFKTLTKDRGQHHMLENEKRLETKKVTEEEKLNQKDGEAEAESEAVTPDREVESPKPTATHSKAASIEFSDDKPKGEVDKLQGKELPSPSIEKLSKEPCEIARPSVQRDAPKVEIFPQFQQDKESIYPVEGTKASEAIANELDKPSAQKLEVDEKGKIDRCCEGGHLEFQEPEKQQSELELQESTDRRSDQEESHEGHEIEEEKAGEQADEVQVEIFQESEVLEDIEVEASEKKRELCAPMVIAGSIFIASLIIFFIGHRRAGRR